MKLVMTLVVRDEADIVDAQIAFHLNAGVDFVIAIDHRSHDGTTEILQSYAKRGHLHVIREEREAFSESEFITRMARLAASEFGADWIINSAADEFWWPRGHDLRDVFTGVPSRYGAVHAVVRNFVPRPDDGSVFSERMTIRLSSQAPINDPGSMYRPLGKFIHRSAPMVRVGRGSHSIVEGDLVPLRGWYPVEVLHFPVRSASQYARKAPVFAVQTQERGIVHRARGPRVLAADSSGGDYEALVIDDEELERGLAEGSLTIDTRVRDALRELRESSGAFTLPAPGASRLSFQAPSVVDDAAYAVDIAILNEADLTRSERRLDELERRIAGLERRPLSHLLRALRRVVRRPSP